MMGGGRAPGRGGAGRGPGHGGAGPGRGTGLQFPLRGRGGGGLPGGMGVSPAMTTDLQIQAANISQMNMMARVHVLGGIPVREPNRSPVIVANTALGTMLVRPRGPGAQAPNVGQSVQQGMLTLPVAHGGSGPLMQQVMPINVQGNMQQHAAGAREPTGKEGGMPVCTLRGGGGFGMGPNGPSISPAMMPRVGRPTGDDDGRVREMSKELDTLKSDLEQTRRALAQSLDDERRLAEQNRQTERDARNMQAEINTLRQQLDESNKKARLAADRVQQQHQHQHHTVNISAAPQQVSAAVPQPQDPQTAEWQAHYAQQARPPQQPQQPQPQSDQHAAAWAAYCAQQARQTAAAVTPVVPMQSMLPPQQWPLPQQQHAPSPQPPQPFLSGGAPPHSMPPVQYGVSPQQYNVNMQPSSHYAMAQPPPPGLSIPPQVSPMTVGIKRPYGH